MTPIRPCREDERGAILAIVNAAAQAYRGVIPADRRREPYMPSRELDEEIAAGVRFDWAIRFYRRHGFEQVSPERKAALLRTYWTIRERQSETSVVLANPPIGA
jgi:hypothetical protein